MNQLQVSKHKADAISNGVFLICLAILFLTNWWWPGIVVAVWANMALRQYLTGRVWDFAVSTAVFLSFIAIIYFQIWEVFIPVLLVISGLFLIFKEYMFDGEPEGEEKSQEIREDTDNV